MHQSFWNNRCTTWLFSYYIFQASSTVRERSLNLHPNRACIMCSKPKHRFYVFTVCLRDFKTESPRPTMPLMEARSHFFFKCTVFLITSNPLIYLYTRFYIKIPVDQLLYHDHSLKLLRTQYRNRSMPWFSKWLKKNCILMLSIFSI